MHQKLIMVRLMYGRPTQALSDSTMRMVGRTFIKKNGRPSIDRSVQGVRSLTFLCEVSALSVEREICAPHAAVLGHRGGSAVLSREDVALQVGAVVSAVRWGPRVVLAHFHNAPRFPLHSQLMFLLCIKASSSRRRVFLVVVVGHRAERNNQNKWRGALYADDDCLQSFRLSLGQLGIK
jgi:hypothetical protein